MLEVDKCCGKNKVGEGDGCNFKWGCWGSFDWDVSKWVKSI